MKPLPIRKDIFLTENDNVINFDTAKLKLAGSGPTDENWLKSLIPGTIFLARPKTKPNQEKAIILQKYMVLEHKTMSTNLAVHSPERQTMDVWVPTLEFSRMFEMVERIGWVEFNYADPTTSEETDGSDQGTIHP